MHKTLTTLAAVAALAVPAAADAASVRYEGPEGAEVLVVTGAAGERNVLSIQDHAVAEAARFYDAGVTWTVETPYCSTTYSSVVCPVPNGVRLELGDGDDWVTRDEAVTEPVTMLGGPGSDRLEGNSSADVIDGGEGTDAVSGAGGDDVLDGGEGGDVVDGASGRDTVRGGGGDDTLHGDRYETASADLIDGGAGVDTIESDYSTRLIGDPEPLLHITLGGGADDGRPGENDDVVNVERLMMSKGGTFIGSDAPDFVKLHQVGDDGTIEGRGGDDELRGGDGVDRIDGGTGNDRLDGGYNDDTITGGPGRDTVSADLAVGDCGPAWCKDPYGNDTVLVRDNEADSVTCGAGADRVVADVADTVAPDCEQVDRGPVPPAPDPKPGPKAKPVSSDAALTVASPRRLAKALREGMKVTLTGFPKGRHAVAARFRGRVVASRKVNVGPKGSATVRVRFTRKARRTLSRRRSATFVVKAGSLTRTVRVAR